MWTKNSFPWWAVACMAILVGASNLLVQIPINDWLTWGALSYPLAFLVNDLVNRFHGAATARKVVYVGFAAGVVYSLVAPNIDTRIAVASGIAFLTAQLLDIIVFDKLRNTSWWIAPSASSAISTVVDTALFFGIAFAGTGAPWVQWAIGDLGVKWLVAFVSVFLFGLIARQHIMAPAHES